MTCYDNIHTHMYKFGIRGDYAIVTITIALEFT